MTDDFQTFLTARHQAAQSYAQGDPDPVVALSADHGQATFFDPGGGFTEGAPAVLKAYRDGAAAFGPGSTTELDIRDSGASGDLAFWTGFQTAEVEMRGKPGRVPMTIRITEVFRRDAGEWRLVHRHASMAKG